MQKKWFGIFFKGEYLGAMFLPASKPKAVQEVCNRLEKTGLQYVSSDFLLKEMEKV